MLPKKNRLKKKKDFEQIFKQGRGFKVDSLYLKIKENNLDSSRFGFIVSKKVSKKAVLRNKIKRKLREIIRLRLKKKDVKIGVDAAIVVMPGFDLRDFAEVNVSKLLEKAKILKNG